MRRGSRKDYFDLVDTGHVRGAPAADRGDGVIGLLLGADKAGPDG